MTNFNTIIFDLDNTLIDTSMLKNFRDKRQWQSCYNNFGSTNIIFNPNELHEYYYIGIVTNSPRNYAEQLLKFYGINYDCLIAYHDTDKHKPDSEPLLKCLKSLNKEVNEAICVGDNYNDTIAASTAEIFSIGVTWGDSTREEHLTNNVNVIIDSAVELENKLNSLFTTKYQRIFLNNNDKLNNMRWHLIKYYPYWLPDGTVNPEFRANGCGRILDLKQNQVSAINYFYQIIDGYLDKGFPICVVPSSDKEKIRTGVRELAGKLSANGRIDATNCLVRIYTIPKAATGGPRNKQVHLNSIKVVNTSLIKGKDVLLLDDITTSGSSLYACEELLLNAGANRVVKLALGQTV